MELMYNLLICLQLVKLNTFFVISKRLSVIKGAGMVP